MKRSIYMRRLRLDDLVDWINCELDNGSRVKASKLYRVFCKYAKIRFPEVSEWELKHYNSQYWNN
jgi:hypothetical protein